MAAPQASLSRCRGPLGTEAHEGSLGGRRVPLLARDGLLDLADPEARGGGPLVVVNGEIHYAHEVQKTNTTQLDTFKSPNRGRAGVMNTGKAYFFSNNTTRHAKNGGFSVDDAAVGDLPRVKVVDGIEAGAQGFFDGIHDGR